MASTQPDTRQTLEDDYGRWCCPLKLTLGVVQVWSAGHEVVYKLWKTLTMLRVMRKIKVSTERGGEQEELGNS